MGLIIPLVQFDDDEDDSSVSEKKPHFPGSVRKNANFLSGSGVWTDAHPYGPAE